MSGLTRFHSDIDALAALLEKLLKVINHSDPSAKNMKVVLYEKYKTRLSELSAEIKQTTSWSVFYAYLNDLLSSDSLPISEESKETVVAKLMKDFESEFIVKHELSEFSPPDPIDTSQRDRLRKIRKQIRNNRKYQHNSFDTRDIVDLMHHKVQQKTAKNSLEKLVKAFNKIDLSKNNK
jgi:hypothetical protein